MTTSVDINVASEFAPLNRASRVLLFMQPGQDRKLVSNTLSGEHQVETTTDVETLNEEFDCCVFDYPQFNRVTGTIQGRRDTSNPTYLPYVLLVGEAAIDAKNTGAWEYVDDVIELPVSREAMRTRIGNLVLRRRTAAALAARERDLEATIEDLKLKEQAMDEAPVGITIAEPGEDDDPLLYINERFQELTGYSSDILGSDCRFLQGDDTDDETRAEVRQALENREPVSVDILNYQKNGRKFWNKLDIAPVRNDDGEVTEFVGFQTDITTRKIRERRLEVLNRVLSHNLHNKMNIIQGHAALLRTSDEETDREHSIESIDTAASDLLGLAETVRKIEQTMGPSTSPGTAVNLDERLSTLLSRFDDQYPHATFELTTDAQGPVEVAVIGLMAALEEAIENAVEHNDSENPAVAISVSRPAAEWIEIEIEDNGPGIPEREIEVLQEGETAVNHADRLGHWLIHWVINKAGGSFEVDYPDSGGTLLTLTVPAAGDNPDNRESTT